MDDYDFIILEAVFSTRSMSIVALRKTMKKMDIRKTAIYDKVNTFRKIGMIEAYGKSPMILNVHESKMGIVSGILERYKDNRRQLLSNFPENGNRGGE